MPVSVVSLTTSKAVTAGSKVRPCLVLRAGPRGVSVLKITSQDQSRYTTHLRLPTAGWDARANHEGHGGDRDKNCE